LGKEDRTAAKSTVMALTVSRLAFAIAVAIILPGRQDTMWATWVCLALVLLIELTDALDGHFARRLGVVSRLGKMLDPYMDSVSRLIVFWTLARANRCLEIVPLLMAVRDLTCAYARIALAMGGRDVSARMTGKIKAVVQGFAAGLLTAGPIYWNWAVWGGKLQAPVIWAFSLAVVAILLVSTVDYVWNAARSWSDDGEARPTDAG